MLEIYNKRRDFEMSKKVLTVAQKYGYASILIGISSLSSVAANLLGNFTSELISSIMGILSTILLIISSFMESEIDDERSELNLGKASHMALLILLILFATSNIIFLYFDNIVITPKILTRFFLGLGALLYGCFFLYYEKEGY